MDRPPSGGAGNAFTFVRSSVGAQDGGGASGTFLTGGMPSAVGAGHLLVAATFATVSSGTTTITFSDNNSDTWVACGGALQGTGPYVAGFIKVFYSLAANSGSPTFSMGNGSTTNFRDFEVSEYSYTGTASLDSSCSGTAAYNQGTASGGVASAASVTSTVTNDLIYAACLLVDSSCSVGTGFTSTDNGFAAFGGQLTESKTGATATSYTPTFATGATDGFMAGSLAFKAQ